MEDISVLQSALLQLVSPIRGVVSVLCFLFLLGRNPGRRKLGLILLVVQIVIAFLEGRRHLIGFFLLGGLIWVGLRGLNFKRMAVAGSVVLLVVGISGPLFLMLRTTAMRNDIRVVDAASRGAILAESSSTVIDKYRLKNSMDPDYVENVKDRAGFFDWTVQVQERVMKGWDTRGGEVALMSVMEVIPRVFFPRKLEALGEFRTEQRIESWFGLPIEDGASTILAYAIADGGLVGVVVYFAAFGALIALLIRFMFAANFPISSFWAAATLFGLCFSIEQDLTALLGALRMLITVVLLDRILQFFFKGQVSSRGYKPTTWHDRATSSPLN